MSAKVQTDQYFAALERLKARGAQISNDAVAIEAGKGRGSIKSSRPAYAKLIEAIEEASKQQKEASAVADPIPGLQRDIDNLKQKLDQSLEREVALLNELYDLRAQNKQLIEENRQLRLGRLVPVR
jgi:signal transduction protein with GAF and PtsI domain